MEKKNSCARAGFSTILWGVLAVLLCAAPDVRAEDIDITEPVQGDLWVLSSTTVNLSADVGGTIWVEPNSHLNIHSGDVGGLGVVVLEPVQGEPNAVVTVYGTDFVVDGTPYETPASVDISYGTLTGKYGDGNDINLLFMSDVPIFLAAPGVAIDIKPGSYPNTINLGSKGVIPVAILSDADFDATTVDPETVSLAGSGVAMRGKGNKLLAHEEDVNGDGLTDLVVKVKTENLDPGTFQDGIAILTIHETSNPESAILFQGSDQISIVPPDG